MENISYLNISKAQGKLPEHSKNSLACSDEGTTCSPTAARTVSNLKDPGSEGDCKSGTFLLLGSHISETS